MNWASIIIIIFAIISLCLGAYYHGKTRIKRDSFWITLVALTLEMLLIYLSGGLR